MKNIFLLIIIVLVVFAMPVTAQEEVAIDPGVTPDSFLWGLEKTIENINLLLTFNVDEKVEKRLKYAEKRLSEIEVMVDEGNIDAALKAEKSHSRLFSDLKEDVRNFESDNSKEDLKKVLKIEQRIREHNNKIETLDEKLNIKIEIRGNITSEQQALINSVLTSLEGQVGNVKIEIENEKDKNKIRIEQELGSNGNDVELEIEEELGLTQELREDAQEEISELEEEISELTEDEITVPETITTILRDAKIAFEAGDYRLAERLAKQGSDTLDEIEEDLEEESEMEIEIEIEEGRAKIEVEINKNEYEFTLNTTDRDVIINEIVVRTGMSREEVVDIAEFEIEQEESDEIVDTKERAGDAIEDAKKNIENAQKDIADAKEELEDVSEAEVRLSEAQSTIEQAEVEFTAENFLKAKELAELADELADEAEELVDASEQEESENKE